MSLPASLQSEFQVQWHTALVSESIVQMHVYCPPLRWGTDTSLVSVSIVLMHVYCPLFRWGIYIYIYV